ncbi:MAG: hypothetical protein KJ922_05180, partial [Nanoarchaeota archaeon]|nr:hypothetical protein [Nanoarchaeota archaeon]
MNKHTLSKNSSKDRRVKIGTKEEFVSEMKRLAKIDKKYLNYSHIRKIKRNDLLVDAIKHFGGWREAVKSAGFKPIQKTWNKNQVIEELRTISLELNHTPKRDELRYLKRSDLERAADRHFGSWNKALIASNLEPNKKTDWTKEKAILKLRQFANKIGHSPSMRELQENNKHDLLSMGLKFFKKYNYFLKAANLGIVLDMNKWSKYKIIKELQEIQLQLGRTPRRNELAAMKRYDLINAAETYFPSWSDALIAAGLVPNPDILDNNKTWKKWENLIFEYLTIRGVVYDKKKYIKKIGYPDVYIPSERKIIEIKLNCSDNSVKKDIQKYLPYCKRLEIWYLYGKPFGILSNKV